MLQQTQVKTVIPYWERWMRALPTIEALATAREERVLKLWEGLGYYSRARNLHKAAQQIVARHGGEFPKRFDEILELPGIGRYTAGAIASIAFGQAAAIVDGNVIRVLTRLFALRGNRKDRLLIERIWKNAQVLVTAAKRVEACSQLNQGLMELGALVCLPRDPNCGVCPLSARCKARARNLTHLLPESPQRPVATARLFRAVLVRRGDGLFLRQRPIGLVNAGFWELPNEEAAIGSSAAGEPLVVIRHSITRYRITLEVYAANQAAGEGELVAGQRLARLPLVNAHRRALEKLGIVPTRKN